MAKAKSSKNFNMVVAYAQIDLFGLPRKSYGFSRNDEFFRFVAKSHDNRSNGGMAFVFVRIFGIETRLGVCEIPKILTSAKLHTPEQIAL